MPSALRYRAWLEALEADRGSVYHLFLRWLIVPGLLIYCVWVLAVPAKWNKELFDDAPGIRYTSPEGVRMRMTQRLEPWRLYAHSAAGVVMVLGCLFQKLSAGYIFDHMRQLAFSSTANPSSSAGASRMRRIHSGLVGPCTLGCMSLMAVAGFAMRSFSMLDSFASIMWLFVAPWPILGALVYFSARTASNPQSQWAAAAAKTHVIFGNAMLYACAAVVYARLMGAVLQRVTQETVDTVCHLGATRYDDGIAGKAAHVVCQLIPSAIVDLGDSAGYYTGIAFSTVLFGALIAVEAWLLLRRCAAIRKRDERMWEGVLRVEESMKSQ